MTSFTTWRKRTCLTSELKHLSGSRVQTSAGRYENIHAVKLEMKKTWRQNDAEVFHRAVTKSVRPSVVWRRPSLFVLRNVTDKVSRAAWSSLQVDRITETPFTAEQVDCKVKKLHKSATVASTDCWGRCGRNSFFNTHFAFRKKKTKHAWWQKYI